MIVHIQTEVKTVFGVLDQEGNVVEQVPVALNLTALKGDMFVTAYEKLAEKKEELVKALEAKEKGGK